MNKFKLMSVRPEDCFLVEGKERILESYEPYLSDESKMDYKPVSAIFFPENTAQVVDAVKRTTGQGKGIVVSASRTGVTGGAIGVDNASIISLEKMTARLGEWHFQAGVKIEDIPVTDKDYYPVDPTEATASLGGTIATNASGPRTFHYGATRNHIKALTIVLADGSVLDIHRGEVVCENSKFVLQHRDGEIVIPIVGISMPPVKNTAGLFLKEDMDLVDLFIGSEGTLGIVTEAIVETAPLPVNRLFLVIYSDTESKALRLVEAIKSKPRFTCLAIEYFDHNAIALIRESDALLNIPGDVVCAVYLEILNGDEDIQEKIDETLASCGLDPEWTWAGFAEGDMLEMKRFRHDVPERVNAIIGARKVDIPGLHKIGTDTAVPEGQLRRILSFARSEVEKEGLQYIVFGHIGDNHLHVNMLPRSMEELKKAEKLHIAIAEESVRLGGTVSAEHGIGRLKKDLLKIQFTEGELAAMKSVKDALDPQGVLNPGVML
ncbi:MAG: FAD-binding oxidoreductase [Actinomycetota bacterium]|nr:FAD-binding oxidoreductase [Actinomycetota bacterium]